MLLYMMKVVKNFIEILIVHQFRLTNKMIMKLKDVYEEYQAFKMLFYRQYSLSIHVLGFPIFPEHQYLELTNNQGLK